MFNPFLNIHGMIKYYTRTRLIPRLFLLQYDG